MSDKIVDRPYLQGYIGDILKLPDGGMLLGNMIANAETKAELLNYDEATVRMATKALLEYKTVSFFGSFVKSVSRDSRIWPSLVCAFSEDAGKTYNRLKDTGDILGLSELQKICGAHKDLKEPFDAMVRAREAVASMSAKSQLNPSPS